MERIDTKRRRELLPGRREPYWYKLSRGCYVGLRKLADDRAGTWIARFRDERGRQHYRALGDCSDTVSFDTAKAAAESWFKDLDRGVADRHEDGEVVTVGSACRAYVRALRAEGRLSTAHDAHMRFRRTVYGDTADAEFVPPASVPSLLGAPPDSEGNTPEWPRRIPAGRFARIPLPTYLWARFVACVCVARWTHGRQIVEVECESDPLGVEGGAESRSTGSAGQCRGGPGVGGGAAAETPPAAS